MRRARAVGLAVGWTVSAPLLAAAIAYPDDPPLGVTGGFGEPTCAACHLPPSAPGASAALEVAGIPETFAPGEVHDLTIELEAPGLARGGFELAARFAEGPRAGRQAGSLAALGAGAAVSDSAGVLYAHHTETGTEARDGSARWRVRWTAPQESATVVFHVAANAANGDDSALGDRVLVSEARARPRATP